MSHGDSIDAPSLLYSNRTKQPFGGHSLSRGQHSECITQLHTFPLHSNCNEEVKCAIVLLNGHDHTSQSLIVISFLVPSHRQTSLLIVHWKLSIRKWLTTESSVHILTSSPLPQVLRNTTQEAPRKPPSILSMKSSIPSPLYDYIRLTAHCIDSWPHVDWIGVLSCYFSLTDSWALLLSIANADTTVVSYGVLGCSEVILHYYARIRVY